jgi:hypothetical protein
MASRKPKAAPKRKAGPKQKAKIGRPTLFSIELAQAICDRIADGESLRSICASKMMPCRATVLTWLADNPDFLGQYARAREAQTDFFAEEVIEIADRATAKTVNQARLRFDARRWFASKVAPKKYGTRIETEVSGKDGGPIQHHVDLSRLTDEQLDTLEEILGSGAAAGSRQGGETPPRR